MGANGAHMQQTTTGGPSVCNPSCPTATLGWNDLLDSLLILIPRMTSILSRPANLCGSVEKKWPPSNLDWDHPKDAHQ